MGGGYLLSRQNALIKHNESYLSMFPKSELFLVLIFSFFVSFVFVFCFAFFCLGFLLLGFAIFNPP